MASEATPLEPARWFTVIANRHYVKPALRDVAITAARATQERYPGTRLRYLDANFPFWTGFPLLPHRSHDDGRKLDLSFLYLTAEGGRPGRSPGFLGYGHVSGPRAGEVDQPAICRQRGYWQYDLLRQLSVSSPAIQLDQPATRYLIEQLTGDRRVGKLFIEPHLKQRLGLGGNPKVRFHGCPAVRHDDHIHVQL
jgi:hypothetical protein